MNPLTLYTIGLTLVILYILMGLDDFIWDIGTLIKRKKQKQKTLSFNELDKTPPKLIAIVIAAWHEDNVLLDVVENIIASQQYPRSMYHIFLGVYPNDYSTVFISQNLEKKYSNVHSIVNYKPGPTSKAQNINYVISKIKDFEKVKNWKFASITIHDSEDLVHPYELKVTNYLIDSYSAIQFPVFPLIKKPTFANFFENITTNTYADEFAENHFITMVNRRNTGAFVPSAGTGFSLSRDTIDVLGYHVLPENSLTEDYRLSLTLYENGLQMHYVLEKLERIDFQGNVKNEYIATRSMFPNTFKTAVKQKTRWTLGITMQSLHFKDIFKKNLSFMGKYSLYRDQKAKIGNIVSIIGYPILIYFLVSLFVPLTPIFPKYSLSWSLGVFVTIMMLERQVIRAIALKNIYGFRSVFFGCLFPPLLPIRIVWGNIINLIATVKAYSQYKKGKQKNKIHISTVKKESPPSPTKNISNIENLTVSANTTDKMMKFEWSKTQHSFLSKEVLSRFHRRFGDVLVAKGYIKSTEFKSFLDKKENNKFIGEHLLNLGLIKEEQLQDALADIKNIPFIQKQSLDFYDFSIFKHNFNKKFLIKHMVLPILKTKNGYVFAYGSSSPIDTQSLLKQKYTLDNQAVLALDESIIEGIDRIFSENIPCKTSVLDRYLVEDFLSVEQLVIVRNYMKSRNQSEIELAQKMFISKDIDKENITIA